MEPWKGKNIAVTGGSGFIGSHLVHTLVTAGANVRVLQHPTDRSTRLNNISAHVEVLWGDLGDPAIAKQFAAGQLAIFHLAALDGSTEFKKTHAAEIFRTNVQVTINILEAARTSKVERILLMSSAEVYPADANQPITESAFDASQTSQPTEDYVGSKRLLERAGAHAAAEWGINVAIARPNNVYGPGDRSDVASGRIIPNLIRQALAGDPIVLWGDGNQSRSFLYVDDLIVGLMSALTNTRGVGIYNFGGSEEITMQSLAKLVVELTGSTSAIQTDPTKPAGATRRVLDIAHAGQTLGWKPSVTIRAGLEKTIVDVRRSSGVSVDPT